MTSGSLKFENPPLSSSQGRHEDWCIQCLIYSHRAKVSVQHTTLPIALLSDSKRLMVVKGQRSGSSENLAISAFLKDFYHTFSAFFSLTSGVLEKFSDFKRSILFQAFYVSTDPM